jgi:hypothetical protein
MPSQVNIRKSTYVGLAVLRVGKVQTSLPLVVTRPVQGVSLEVEVVSASDPFLSVD